VLDDGRPLRLALPALLVPRRRPRTPTPGCRDMVSEDVYFYESLNTGRINRPNDTRDELSMILQMIKGTVLGMKRKQRLDTSSLAVNEAHYTSRCIFYKIRNPIK